MLEVSLADSAISPLVDFTSESAFTMYAATELVIVFWASPTPTEIATPAVPANEAAIEAAPVCTLIEELSSAFSRIDAAVTPVPSPSI